MPAKFTHSITDQTGSLQESNSQVWIIHVHSPTCWELWLIWFDRFYHSISVDQHWTIKCLFVCLCNEGFIHYYNTTKSSLDVMLTDSLITFLFYFTDRTNARASRSSNVHFHHKSQPSLLSSYWPKCRCHVLFKPIQSRGLWDWSSCHCDSVMNLLSKSIRLFPRSIVISNQGCHTEHGRRLTA